MKISLLDYGAGNVRSVYNALHHLDATVIPVRGPDDIRTAHRLLFPGVGAFGNMMTVLQQRGYVEAIREFLATGRPFFGICLGMQALFDQSEESPDVPGLGILSGRVRRFQTDLAVPHMGWNGIRAHQKSVLFDGLQGDERFYFVHSYYVDPQDTEVTLATCDYGQRFTCAVQQDHIMGTQFHPEKSGVAGLRLLSGFIRDDARQVFPVHVPQTTCLARRIIACLDVRSTDDGTLVVTKGDQYDVRQDGAVRNLGDPVELAGRYYREGADEITFLNITGFRHAPLADLPMREVLQRTSENVFVPLTIGGGIRDTLDDNGQPATALQVADVYFRSGADKISIGSDAVLSAMEYLRTGQKTGTTPIEEISRVYGAQAVVVSVDPRRVYVNHPDDVPHTVIETAFPGPHGERFCWYQCTVRGGREGVELDAVTFARCAQELGAGEVLLNCIDRDGTNDGFDIELINAVKNAVSIPVIASSGAGTVAHFAEVFEQTRADAALAAGIFHRGEITIDEVKDELSTGVAIRR